MRIPDHVRQYPAAFLHRSSRRATYALLLSCAVTTIGCAAAFLTAASETVNLVFEPAILLLMPGIFSGLLVANITGTLRHQNVHGTSHDYAPIAVIVSSLVFYFLFFFQALWWRARRKAARPPRQPSTSRP